MVNKETGVPIPLEARHGYQRIPLEQLDVGDSYFFDDLDGRLTHRIRVKASQHQRVSDCRYVTRRILDDAGRAVGVRVWRTE